MNLLKDPKTKKERMLIYSLTAPASLVARALKYDPNFSRFTRDAIEQKIKFIEKQNKK